jgi:hypothetical protein
MTTPWSNPAVNLIIIVSGAPNTGLFLYNGTPAHGNPPVLWAVAPGVTADPFGNTVAAVLGAGTPGGPSTQIDASGDVTLTGAAGTTLQLQPSANLPFALTTALTGIMQSVMTLGSGDSNQLQAGIVSGITLGTGATAKMGTLITSPYGGTSGFGILLQAENDGSTDTPFGTFGTVSTQGGTLTFQPVMALLPFAVIVYASGGTITVNSRTSGSGTIPIPVTVSTVLAECWASGTGGPNGVVGSGPGGPEYAAEPSLSVTPGGTIAYSVPGPGGGGIGATSSQFGTAPAGNTTLTGTVVTVTAHPGGIGYNGTVPVNNAGTGSTNTVHHDGGNGGFQGLSAFNGGASGASSAGPLAAGTAGNTSSGNTGAPQAVAPSGGGNGGKGGNGGATATGGLAGTQPGGSGGMGGKRNDGFGAAGSAGQAGLARVTWTTGAPPILMSSSQVAGTDQFGTAYGAGDFVTLADGNTYRTERIIKRVSSRAQTVNSTTGTAIAGLSAPVGIGTYVVEGRFWLQWNAAAGQPGAIWTGPAISQYDVVFTSKQQNASAITNIANSLGANTVNGAGYNASALNITVAMTAAGANFLVDFWGVFTFTAAGTLQLNGTTSVAADTWIWEFGYFRLEPA